MPVLLRACLAVLAGEGRGRTAWCGASGLCSLSPTLPQRGRGSDLGARALAFVALAVAVLALAGCEGTEAGGVAPTGEAATGSPTQVSRTQVIIDWVDFLQWDGIQYWPVVGPRPSGRTTVGRDALGAAVGEVRRRIADLDLPRTYQPEDGDASFLSAGDTVYEVEGYAPAFRMAVEHGSRLYLYEAGVNPRARWGRDLLDIEGRVTGLALLSPVDGTVARRIDDAEAVARLVEMIAESEVRPGEAPVSDRRRVLLFELDDGTTATRVFWEDRPMLSGGIMLPPEFGEALEAALGGR